MITKGYAYRIQVEVKKCSIETQKYYNIHFGTDYKLSKEEIDEAVRKEMLVKVGRVRYIEYEFKLISMEIFYDYKRNYKWEVE